MTNKNEKTAQSNIYKNVVYSKLDYSWLLVGTYLDIMRAIGCVSSDKEFYRLYNEMRDYVDKKITTKCVGDINDIFVVAEQIISADRIK